jgi:GLPGLI family protein
MDWKILPETVKIGEYEAQKAETTFEENGTLGLLKIFHFKMVL